MKNYLGDVSFPPAFVPLDAVQPGLIPLTDGSWLISAYGAMDAQAMRMHVFQWRPGQVAQELPLQLPTSARGSLAGAGGAAWLFGWHKQDPSSREKPRLVWQNVPGVEIR